MQQEVFVNEEINVLVRVMNNGSIRPTSFLWRDKNRYVSDVGRQWEERVDGRAVRCFLIQTVDNNTYEICWDPAGDRWVLYRAWLHDLVV